MLDKELQSFNGTTIHSKENNLQFLINATVDGELEFHLVKHGLPKRFTTLEQKGQINEYNVFTMNNILLIIKNGLVLNKIHNFTSEEIIVKFKSSTKTLWIILNVCGDEKNRRPCHIEHSNCWEYENVTAKYSQDLLSFQSDAIYAEEDNLRFLIKSPIAGTLHFNLVIDNRPVRFSIPEEENHWNHYNVLPINNTVCVIRNGYIIKQINSSALEKIGAKISSSRDTSWIVFNVCGTGKRKQCKIHSPTSKHQKHLTEYSLENVPKASGSTGSCWSMVTIIAISSTVLFGELYNRFV
jgi:hypothetical protein